MLPVSAAGFGGTGLPKRLKPVEPDVVLGVVPVVAGLGGNPKRPPPRDGVLLAGAAGGLDVEAG